MNDGPIIRTEGELYAFLIGFDMGFKAVVRNAPLPESVKTSFLTALEGSKQDLANLYKDRIKEGKE